VTWAGDITYIPTGGGWLFLATVIDLFSRRVIGWGVADHLRTPLVSSALEMAVATRGGHVDGVVFHSDRGATPRCTRAEDEWTLGPAPVFMGASAARRR
jgi:transposase InsO family protein